MSVKQTHRNFILFIACFQVLVVCLFCIFVRYDEPLDSLFHANRTSGAVDNVMANQYHSKFCHCSVHDNETKNSPIHEFRVPHKGQRVF